MKKNKQNTMVQARAHRDDAILKALRYVLRGQPLPDDLLRHAIAIRKRELRMRNGDLSTMLSIAYLESPGEFTE